MTTQSNIKKIDEQMSISMSSFEPTLVRKH